MARASPLKTSFSGGEITPRLDGQVNLPFYPNSARTLQNMIVLPHGPATRRPGSIFQDEVKDSSKFTRLLEFEFSQADAVAIEAGENYFRFYRDRARITAPVVAATITNGDFTSDTSGWTDESTGTGAISHDATLGRLNLDGVSGGANVAIAQQEVTTTDLGVLHVLTFDTFLLGTGELIQTDIDVFVGSSSGDNDLLERIVTDGSHSVSFTPAASPFFIQFRFPKDKTVQIDNVALTSGGSPSEAQPVEIPTPWLAADLPGLKYDQSNDVVWLVHPDRFARKLERRSDHDWSLVLFETVDGPWGLENIAGGVQLNPSATTGLGITITATGKDPFWFATDVGRLVRINHASTWGVAIVTAFTSGTVVDADVLIDFGAATAQSAWRLGLYSDTSGHPAAVGFHEQRLILAGHEQLPIDWEASAIGDFPNYTPGIADADPISAILAAQDLNKILWIHSEDVIIVGTSARIWRIGSKTNETPLTPVNSPAKAQARIGCADIRPVDTAGRLLFLEKGGRRLREINYSFENDRYAARDVTLRAEHITLGGLTDLAYQQRPWSIAWAPRADGRLIGFTYLPEEEVFAWHQHPLGASLAGPAVVESVAVIPSAAQDELWLVVKRTINGATKRYIERLDDDFTDDRLVEDAVWTDSAVIYDGAATTTIAGLDHLEGETVQILADGAGHPDKVVSGGEVTLDRSASKAIVGLGSIADVVPTRFEAGAREGTAQGKIQRVARVSVNFYRSMGMKVGRNEATLETVPFRQPEDLMDAPVPLFTGEKVFPVPGIHEPNPTLLFRQDLPLPFTILSLAPEMETHEG
jgi:hypothetical protein